MLRAYTKSLRNYARYLTRNEEDAKDLFQETALRTWRYYHRFARGTNFYAWATRIMVNIHQAEARKASRRQRLISERARPNEAMFQAESVESDATAILMRQAIDDAHYGLPAATRSVFSDVRAGQSYRAIAEERHLPIGTVKSRVHAARESIARACGLRRRDPHHASAA